MAGPAATVGTVAGLAGWAATAATPIGWVTAGPAGPAGPAYRQRQAVSAGEAVDYSARPVPRADMSVGGLPVLIAPPPSAAGRLSCGLAAVYQGAVRLSR